MGDQSNGKLWKSRSSKKKEMAKRNQTPGSSKGSNCQAGPQDRTMAKRNRSWKSKVYQSWLLRKNGSKKVGVQ